MDTAQVVELIKRAKALEASSNPNEAANAAAKVQELLLKYNLSQADLQDDEPATPATRQELVTSDTSSWVSYLYGGVARAHGCYLVQSHTYRRGNVKPDRLFEVFGRPANVQVVEYLSTYLYREIRRLANASGYGTVHHRNAFHHGAVQMVVHRLNEGLKTFQSTADTTALVQVLDAEALALRDLTYPKLGKSRGGSHGREGYAAGVNAGKSISLHHGIGASRNAGGQFLLGGR